MKGEEVYFRENIFAPLGMTDTGFLIGSAQKRRVATTYRRQQDGSLTAMPFEMPQRPEFFSGGGGLFGTPRGYMAFLQMFLVCKCCSRASEPTSMGRRLNDAGSSPRDASGITRVACSFEAEASSRSR